MSLSGFITEAGHVCILSRHAVRRMRGPGDAGTIEDVRPLWVVLLLFAFLCYFVHEFLRTLLSDEPFSRLVRYDLPMLP